MRRALFWMLLPFAVPQALRVRRTAPRFAAATGPSVGTVGDGPGLRLLAIGDSIVAGVGAGTTDRALAGATASALAQRLGRRVVWRAHGKIGAGVEKVRLQLGLLDERAADIVVISVGVNDITSLMRSQRWARALDALLDDVRRLHPRAIVALAGIPPLQGFPLLPFPLKRIFGLRGSTFNAAASRAVARRAGMVFLPLNFDPQPSRFSADGFHPSPESYGDFGDAFAERIAPLVAVQRSSSTIGAASLDNPQRHQ